MRLFCKLTAKARQPLNNDLTMKKKEYIVPNIKVVTQIDEPLLNGGSKIGDQNDGAVIPTDEPYNGEFNSLDNNIWDYDN